MYGSENPPSPVDQLGFWVVRLAQAVKAEYGSHLSGSDVGLTEYWALRCIHNGDGTCPSAIAQVLGVDRAQATRLVKNMAKRGWIRRSRDGADLRTLHITITDRGRSSYEQLSRMVDQAERDFAQGFTTEQLEQFQTLLNNRLNRAGGWDLKDF
jgi:DNA-binding MarR family transcriptional regulator